jgi:hypothetical protein
LLTVRVGVPKGTTVTTVRENAILVVTVEVDPADAPELHRWYDEEHGPEKLALAGFVSMRRFRAHDTPNRFLTLYELEYPEAATSDDYMNQMQTQWTRDVMAKWQQWDRSVWIEFTSDAR